MIINRYDLFNKELVNGSTIPTYMKEEFKVKFDSIRFDLYVISTRTELRPDLIAYLFLGSEALYWAISYINGIDNSPEGYYLGRTIKIPRKSELLEML